MASEAWDTEDYALEVTWEVLHGMDWMTTRQIAKHPEAYHEMNPILGGHPHVSDVDMYMLGTALIHPIIANYLPKPYREVFQMISITVSGTCVLNNISVGLEVRW